MWRVRVATEQYTLYPNQFPEDVPIAQIAEYNVTIDSNSAACTDNVTFSLLLTENVIQHVPYVECIIRTGSGATAESHTSDRVPVIINVPSTTQTPPSQTTVTPTVVTNTTTERQGHPFTLTPEVAVDVFSTGTSGSCKTDCHDRVLLLLICIYFYIFTNLY